MEIPSLTQWVREIAETAGFLWERGWAERNAGNISVNVTGLLSAAETDLFKNMATRPLQEGYPSLSDQILLVTSAGGRMRDLAKNPWDHLCIVKTDTAGSRFTLWPESGRVPTSELPTHLAVHDMLLRKGSTAKALVHTHATELIALTQIRELCNTDTLNRLLRSMHPETILFVRQGLGFIPFELSGTAGIAEITAMTLEDHPLALWEKHGVLATGTTAADAFDTIDLLAKSARIYFMVKQSGSEPEGLTDAQLNELMY